MTDLGLAMPRAEGDRSQRASRMFWALLVLLILAAVTSLGCGAAGVSLDRLLADLVSTQGVSDHDRLIVLGIRAPRIVLAALIGAALAVSGALMQGLFRNPLADPGTVGVSAGAALGAVLAIVLGRELPLQWAGLLAVPTAAFLGSLTATLLLTRVATRGGATSVATLLLAGIGFAGLSMAVTGVVITLADDSQLRDLTFWSLGSLAGASWTKVLLALPLIALALPVAQRLAPGLNALTLGEAQAAHLGIEVEHVKRLIILAVAAATGAAVAMSGGIAFVGIVVPHLMRLVTGPDHRYLLRNVAVLGATLLIAADTVARLVVAPAELPIGIITALIGAPAFLWILLARGAGMRG